MSSADPLLTTLCTICHVSPPKYTCPRCAARTCSLACSRKHKAWASCSGVRDPAAYVPAQALRTPAGIDRDYNFLSGIERARERQHRLLVEERGLLGVGLDGKGDERLVRKLWFGEGGVRMPHHQNQNQNQQRGPGKRPWQRDAEGDDDEGRKESYLDRKVRRRLGHLDVRVVEMPRGLSRQRENTTCWNRRTNKINWAVEWLVFDTAEGATQHTTTRIRHRALETVPLFRAAADSIAWYRKGQERAAEEEEEDGEDMLPARKRRRVLIREVKEERRSATLGAMQDWEGEQQGTWLATHYPVQNPFTGTWDLERGSATSMWARDEEADEKRRSQFFLLKPLTPAGQPKELIPLGSTETLAQALPGRTVLEFPTIYVLPPSATLPEGYVLGSTDRRERPQREQTNRDDRGGPRQQQQAGKKRPQEQQQRGRGKHQQKKVAFIDKKTGVEQGEVNSDGEVLEEEDITSSEPETTSSEDSSSDSEVEVNAPEEVKNPKTRNGLVDYASDSESGSEEGEDEEAADLDLSTLNPENPELVRGAIAEIVNLFT